MRLFSKRHQKSIFDKKIRISIPIRLRNRIWKILIKFNHSIGVQRDPTDRWIDNSDILAELPDSLEFAYGIDALKAFNEQNQLVNVDLKGFVKGAYPAQVLDVIESFYDSLLESLKFDFQKEINNVFEEEKCPWRLADGQFFQVDSNFLEIQVLAKSQELMKVEGFQGALDEFLEARNDLSDGDFKGVIHNACKSFESALKTILICEIGNASALIREFINSDYLSDIPQKIRQPFGEIVLMSLPFLRNRLGGHGQGDEILEVPKRFSELAVHLCGSLILFIIQSKLEIEPKEINKEQIIDEIPF